MKGFLKYHIKDRLALGMQHYRLRAISGPPILLFTMAKVGSLSVYNSLQKSCKNALFHIHSLDLEEEQRHITYCREHDIYPGSRTPVFAISEHVLQKKRPYQVITLFRNPIERNISAFFDAFHLHVGVKPEAFSGSTKELEQCFFEKVNHEYAINWFRNQFYKGTGIDVYNFPFNPEQGYGHISRGEVEVLLLNSGLKDDRKEVLIREFCQLEQFQLKNVNITSQSAASALYQDFKHHIRFSEEYLNTQLNSQYARHFFTREERDALFEKWAK